MNENSVKIIYYGFIVTAAVIVLGVLGYESFATFFAPPAASTAPLNLSLADQVVAGSTGDGSVPYANFAKCLTAKGAAMYGASWCPHCQNQKKMFGAAVEYIKYVECAPPEGGQAAACTSAGIEAYPTWLIEGQKYLGEKTFEELAQLTGCAVQ
ncbi:MAG: hypothetical protein V1492_01110 [Candidatus Micrarchaeota archaeon]